jgi:hypothetical protein
MSDTQKILEERHDLALSVIDKIEWTLEPVECDDYGDTAYNWYIRYILKYNDKDYDVWEDYYMTKPNDVQAYNNLLENIKHGFVGDTIADILTQNRREQ